LSIKSKRWLIACSVVGLRAYSDSLFGLGLAVGYVREIVGITLPLGEYGAVGLLEAF